MVTGWLSDFLKYEVNQGRVNFLFPGGALSISNGSNREPFAAITDVLKNSRLSMMKVSTCFFPPTFSSRHSMSG